MKRLSRYLFRHLFVAAAFITTGLTLVIWVTQSLRLLEIVVDGGAPFSLFLELMLVTLPTFLSLVLPIALVGAVLFTYNKLTLDSEMVVMRAAGLSPAALARPAMFLGFIVMAICFLLTLYAAPAANRQLVRLERVAKNDYSSAILHEGVFNDIDPTMTIYVRDRTSDGELRGILIHDTRTPGTPVTVMAERGTVVEGSAGTRVIVYNGTRQELDRATGKLSQLEFDRYAIDLKLFSQDYAPRQPDARERGTDELLDAWNNGGEPRLIAELNQRLSSPLFAMAFTLVGLSALLSGEFNRRGQARRILTAVILVTLLQSAGLGIGNLAANNNRFVPLQYGVALVPVAVGLFLLVRGGFGRRRRPAR